MDKFKNFLLENKSRLDVEEAPGDAWKNIKKRIDNSQRNKTIVLLLRWSAAACIIVLAGIGLYTLTEPPAKRLSNREMSKRTISTPIKDSTSNFTNKDWTDTTIQAIALLPAKKIKKHARSRTSIPRKIEKGIDRNRFLDQALVRFVAAIENQKTVISSTPVFGVDENHFKEIVMQYRSLEQDEEKLKNKTKASGASPEILNELIQTLKRRMDILMLLKAEMDKTNDRNKNKAGEKTYVNII
jgi:hypothetical protein